MPDLVINAAPWICLSIINQTGILPDMYNEIYMPETVADEILSGESKRYGRAELINCPWINKRKCSGFDYEKQLMVDLDKGELDVILLARELRIKNVLIDETIGRKIAELQGLRPIGTLGILVKAKKMNLIKRVKPYIELLLANRIWLSDELVITILKKVDEHN